MTPIKISLKKIVNSAEALIKLGNEKIVCKNSGKITYAISKNIAQTDPHVIAFQKSQQNLMEKYRVLTKVPFIDANKQLTFEEKWIIPPKDQKAYEAEIEEILAEEIELEIRPVVFPEPTEESSLPLSSVDLYLLDWMVSIEGYE